MWLGNPIDIEVPVTANTPIGCQVFDDISGQPIDITDMYLTCSVAKSEGEEVFVRPIVDIVEPIIGQFDISFNGSSFPVSATSDVNIFAYEVRADDGKNTVVLMRGSIIVTPGVN